MRYVKGFDTIRALAVFFVIIEHWGPFFAQHTALAYFKSAFLLSGDFGVNLFFVLSGFLISSILLNEKMKATDGQHFLIIKNFFVRRVLRIFPIYYLVIVLCCILNYQFVREHIWYYLTYTSNFLPYLTNKPNVLSHTWSLAVEEQFYILWPWLIILVNKKYLKYIFYSAIVLGIVSRYMALFVYHHAYPVLVINCFDSFGIGALYAYVRLDNERNRRFQRTFITVFPLLLFVAWRISSFGGYRICYMYYKVLDSIIAIALIMFAISNKNEWIRRYILENRFLNFIGKISYGIYLYHYTFGPAYDTFAASFAHNNPGLPAFFTGFYVSYCIKLILLILICWASFRFLEQPILRLKKKFEYPQPVRI